MSQNSSVSLYNNDNRAARNAAARRSAAAGEEIVLNYLRNNPNNKSFANFVERHAGIAPTNKKILYGPRVEAFVKHWEALTGTKIKKTSKNNVKGEWWVYNNKNNTLVNVNNLFTEKWGRPRTPNRTESEPTRHWFKNHFGRKK
jgi:hypothetical protein